MNIGTIPDGIDRVIIGYHRLDLGQPVVGQYVNNDMRSSITFSSLVPGAKYRITAWGLGGGSNRIRSRAPAVVEVTTNQTSELMGTAHGYASHVLYILDPVRIPIYLEVHYVIPYYMCCVQVHLLQETTLSQESFNMELS